MYFQQYSFVFFIPVLLWIIARIKSLILNIMNAYRPVGLFQVGLGWFGSVGV